MKKHCPNCGELLVIANLGNGDKDVYCEDCQWPEDPMPPSPLCVICEKPSVGECGDQMRCEEHWVEPILAEAYGDIKKDK